MSVVGVLMLGELRLKALNVTAEFKHHRHLEAVRLGDFVDRFPKGSTLGELKNLPRSVRAQGLHADHVGHRASQPELQREQRDAYSTGPSSTSI
jgi:hypothetical protein